ncbi:MAG: phosphate/phosphite/phosphonate ABC transporter substrate-binding protein [Planctomycetota bacterium]
MKPTHRRGFSLVRVLAVLIPLAVILLIAFVPLRNQMATPPKDVNSEAWAQLFKLDLDARVDNRLDPRFADKDQNLVADPPTDPGDFVDPDILTFCYIPDDDDEATIAAWDPLLQALSAATGREVRYMPLNSAEAQLQSLANGSLHIAGLNTGAVPVAVNLAGFVPVAKLPGIDGSGIYTSQVIVPATSPIQSVEQLRGTEIMLTHPRSNSGYKAPVVLLSDDYDLQPGRDYQVRISGSHYASILSIAQDAADAAAVASDLLTREVNEGTISPDSYRVVYTSPSFPTACIGFVYNLDPSLASAIEETLMEFDWIGSELVGQISTGDEPTMFAPVDYMNDWALIRQIDDKTGNQHRIQTDG